MAIGLIMALPSKHRRAERLERAILQRLAGRRWWAGLALVDVANASLDEIRECLHGKIDSPDDVVDLLDRSGADRVIRMPILGLINHSDTRFWLNESLSLVPNMDGLLPGVPPHRALVALTFAGPTSPPTSARFAVLGPYLRTCPGVGIAPCIARPTARRRSWRRYVLMFALAGVVIGAAVSLVWWGI